jgi:hypothetical protein
VPASRDDLGPFYQDVIAVSPLEPWDAASAAYRLEILARTLPFPVGGVLVHGDRVTALIDLEFARVGPRDLELISVVRALDAETRLGIQRPPLLAWLAEDYPELFGTANLTIGTPGWSAWRK